MSNNNTNNNNRNNQILEIVRDSMESLHNNIYHYNNNIRDYNHNIRTMLDMIHSTRTDTSTILQTYPRYSTVRRRPYLNGTNVENDFINLVYQRVLNAFVTGLENDYTNTSGVTQGLTQEQINQHTQDILYTPDLNQTTCHICQEDFVENETVCQIMSCRHIFHKPELMTWFERHSTCPVCRQDVTRPPTRQPRQRNNTQNTQEASSSSRTTVPREHPVGSQLNLDTQTTNELLDNFSNVLTNMISNQTPQIDSSGSLVYTFDFPIYNYLNRL